MSIRIGIYDFFAYTIPGGLMLCIVLGVLDTCGQPDLWAKMFSLNTMQIFLLIIACYLTGFVINPILSKWSAFFEPENFEKDALDRLKKRNPNLVFDINPSDWAIWFASIRRESMEMALEIDRFLVLSKMVRGISLFLLLSAILGLVNILLARVSGWYLPLVALFFILSLVSIRESIKFKRWFYFEIYETIISRSPKFVLSPDQNKKKIAAVK